MTVVEHLTELRRRLIISLVAVAVAGDDLLHLLPVDHQFLISFYKDSTRRARKHA